MTLLSASDYARAGQRGIAASFNNRYTPDLSVLRYFRVAPYTKTVMELNPNTHIT